MQSLLRTSAAIDGLLAVVAKIGAWCGFILVAVVCIDVVTRYFGVPKPFGMNSTQLQESEYWFHTILFTLVIGYAYTRQAHVRIDLVRDKLPRRAKFGIEIFGIVFFLLTYAGLGFWYTFAYTHASFLEGEVSKSTIGLSHIWILKSTMPAMFVLLGLAGISQLIKAIAGYRDELPEDMVSGTLGGDV